MNRLSVAAAAGLALLCSGCVAVPLDSPFITGDATGAAAPVQTVSLRDQLAGRSLSSFTTTHYLWSDGTLTIERSGVQGFGSWSVNGNIATFSSVSGDTPIAYTLG